MAALAVGVVHDRVEQRDLPIDVVAALTQREEVLGRIELHEALEGSQTLRPVAQDGWRHARPAERTRHRVRGDLAAAERSVGEIPERRLAGARLVDTEEVRVTLA